MDKHADLGVRILHFPLVKIIIGFFVCVSLASLGAPIAHRLLQDAPISTDLKKLIAHILMAALSLAGYILLYRYYERRKIKELSLHRFLGNYGLGLLIGIGFQVIVILVIFLSGSIKITGVNPIAYLLPALAMGISSSVLEKILFRGILFRITEEKLGSYISLLISGLLFGFMHLSNKNSSVMMSIAIAIEAGLMLGAAYMCTRSLWLPIAIHFGWNFTEGGIFGAPVSGNTFSKSLLQIQIQGNELLTGGAFGPEGSLQAILFGLIIFILMMVYSHRHNRVIAPPWAKSKLQDI